MRHRLRHRQAQHHRQITGVHGQDRQRQHTAQQGAAHAQIAALQRLRQAAAQHHDDGEKNPVLMRAPGQQQRNQIG
ncbi:hypothetical protein SDC9_127538 [bioreactor metagenome]|uniref:Uncharacterized protein n=1 Tax=bioreactor metagenome TaxID=1076179 RepID=A0A645CUB1_9ZZZZ